MADLAGLFGTDLRLLPFLDALHGNRDPGNDLAVTASPDGRDLATVSGTENLVQALVLRLLTPAGDLAALGHPDYGSRLHELIGELNDTRNRNRAKMFALQALTAEPRVRRVLSLEVVQASDDRTRADVKASLDTIEEGTPLNLVFPFFFEQGSPA
jgi:phage baseplate assembly protein W